MQTHQIESTVSLPSGFDLAVKFDYTIDSWLHAPAILHLAPEDCCPDESEFIFTIDDLHISNWCDKWWPCNVDKLKELIYDQLDNEVLEHAEKDF